MTRTYSLAQLIALPYAPPQLMQLAHTVGCGFVGIRVLPAAPGGLHHAVQDNPALLRETKAVMAGTGVRVLDVELVRLSDAWSLGQARGLLDVSAALGARHILVAGDDADHARTTAQFVQLCEAAAPLGLTCDLEFMPWTGVKTVREAAAIVAAAAQPNGGVLVDGLHWGRSASTLADVAALPREVLHYAQICDGAVPPPTTVEGLIHDARCERLLPGEGGIDLPALFAQLPADLPISVEVPSETRAPKMGYEAWARLALAMARQTLEPDATHGHHRQANP